MEFPLHASAQQASGRPRQYLDPRTNAVGTGSFSAAVVDDDGALAFRRQGCVLLYIYLYDVM